MKTMTRLCHKKSMETVNGKFTGPHIMAKEGDRLLFHAG